MNDSLVIKELNICGHNVKVSKHYHAEFEDKDGKTVSVIVNPDYVRELYLLFDGHYKELFMKDLYGELSDTERLELERYCKIFEKELVR